MEKGQKIWSIMNSLSIILDRHTKSLPNIKIWLIIIIFQEITQWKCTAVNIFSLRAEEVRGLWDKDKTGYCTAPTGVAVAAGTASAALRSVECYHWEWQWWSMCICRERRACHLQWVAFGDTLQFKVLSFLREYERVNDLHTRGIWDREREK